MRPLKSRGPFCSGGVWTEVRGLGSRTSMALSHQFIWSSTSLMLCFMRSGGRSLAWPTTAGWREETGQ